MQNDDNQVLIRALITQVRFLEAQNTELQTENASLKAGIPAPHSLPAAIVSSPEVQPPVAAPPTLASLTSKREDPKPVAPPPPAPSPTKEAPKLSSKGVFDNFNAYLAKWESPSSKPVRTADIEADCRKRFPEIAEYAPSTLKQKIQAILSGRTKAGTLAGSTAGYWSLHAKEPVKPKKIINRLPSLPPEEASRQEMLAVQWVRTWFEMNKEGTLAAITKAGSEHYGVPNGSKWSEFVLKALHVLKGVGQIQSLVGKGYFLNESAPQAR